MPQEKKKKAEGPVPDGRRRTGTKLAAELSIKLREGARQAKNPVIRKLGDVAADAALRRAMRLNKKTREERRTSRGD